MHIIIGHCCDTDSFAALATHRIGLLCLALGGTIGMTFVILACALKQYNLWWPFFVVIFYLLSILPRLVVKSVDSQPNAWKDASIFFTVGVILSSFALPIVLARAAVILWGACYLTLLGNIVIYVTIASYFTLLQDESGAYLGAY